jgi:hypothetical protein
MNSDQSFKKLILEMYADVQKKKNQLNKIKEEEKELRSKSGKKLKRTSDTSQFPAIPADPKKSSGPVIGDVDAIKVDYKNDRPSTDVDNAVLDRKIKSIAKKVQKEAKDKITDILFGRKRWKGGSKGTVATTLEMKFGSKKPLTASILPDDRVVFSNLSNKWMSPELREEIYSFLETFKSTKGKSSKLTTKDITISNSLQSRGNDLIAKIAKDADDTVKKATLTRERVGGGKDPNINVILRVEFQNIGVFMAGAKVSIGTKDDDIYMYNRLVKAKSGGTGLSDPKSYVNVDKKPYKIKTTVGSSLDKQFDNKKGIKDKDGFISVNKDSSSKAGEYIVYLSDLGLKNLEKDRGKGIEDITPYKGKKYVKEGSDSPKAVFKFQFKNKNGQVVDADWLSTETKNELQSFMNDVDQESLREDNNMNNNDFKKRISEIAAQIADEKSEAKGIESKDGETVQDKLRKLKSTLEPVFNSINTEDDFAYVVVAVREMMQKLSDQAARGGLRLATQVMQSSKPVSKDAPGAMYDKMPVPDNLQETYNRIKRK